MLEGWAGAKFSKTEALGLHSIVSGNSVSLGMAVNCENRIKNIKNGDLNKLGVFLICRKCGSEQGQGQVVVFLLAFPSRQPPGSKVDALP